MLIYAIMGKHVPLHGAVNGYEPGTGRDWFQILLCTNFMRCWGVTNGSLKWRCFKLRSQSTHWHIILWSTTIAPPPEIQPPLFSMTKRFGSKKRPPPLENNSRSTPKTIRTPMCTCKCLPSWLPDLTQWHTRWRFSTGIMRMENKHATARHFQVDGKRIHDWVKKEDHLQQLWGHVVWAWQRCSWLFDERAAGRPTSNKDLQMKALELASGLGIPSTFKASPTWVKC